MAQFFLHFRHGKGFQIVFRVGRIGLRPRLRSRGLGLVAMGFMTAILSVFAVPQVS